MEFLGKAFVASICNCIPTQSSQTCYSNPDQHPAQPRFVNWWTVWNMSMSLVTRRQKRSKRPKISVSLKSNCLPQASSC